MRCDGENWKERHVEGEIFGGPNPCLWTYKINFHRTARLPVELRSFDAWAVAPKEESVLWVFEGKVLWSLFVFKKEEEEENRGNFILGSLRFCTSSKYYYGYQIIYDDMDSARGAGSKNITFLRNFRITCE